MSRVYSRNKWMNTPKGDERCNPSKVTIYKVPIGTLNKDIDKLKAKIVNCGNGIKNLEYKI